MTYIFCIDDKCGMLFLGKRQSRDRILNARLLSLIGQGDLYVTSYSASLFADHPALRIGEEPKGEGFAFVEDGAYDLSLAEEVWLCRWNRHYPGDRFFDMAALQNAFRMTHTTDIVGSSHEKITIETWRHT
jgi:hypothetical protein